MFLSKKEFAKYFKYNGVPAVCRLVREEKIKIDKNGLIDTEEETTNKPFCLKRAEKIKRLNKPEQVEEPKEVIKPKPKEEEKKENYSDQLALEIDFLNAKLEEKRQNTVLTKLKIAKEQNDVIETEVLNRCIQAVFADMIKNMTEIPNIYAADLIKIVQAEDEPKEIIVEFLTQKITNTIKQGLQSAKIAAKKYYMNDEFEITSD